jgi:hypothetical protein
MRTVINGAVTTAPSVPHPKTIYENAAGGGGEISLLPAMTGIYHAANHDEGCAGEVSTGAILPG